MNEEKKLPAYTAGRISQKPQTSNRVYVSGPGENKSEKIKSLRFDADHFKWVCISKDRSKRLSFDARHVLSAALTLFFRHKERITVKSLQAFTSLRWDKIKLILTRLVRLQLLAKVSRKAKTGRESVSYRPLYNPAVYLRRKRFNEKRWWQGIHSRKVRSKESQTHVIKRRGKDVEAPKTFGFIKPVLVAFIKYANAKGARIGPAYLSLSTGIPFGTVNRICWEWRKQGLVSVDKKSGIQWLLKEPKTGNTFTISDLNARTIARLLAPDWDNGRKDRIGKLAIASYDRFQQAYKYVEAEGQKRGEQFSFSYLENILNQWARTN